MQKRVSHTIGSVTKDLALRFDKADLYYGHGTDNAYDEAAWLVLFVLGKPLYQDCDATEFVSDENIEKIQVLAEERISTRKPLAYLLQSSWFCGLEFYIDERALIPRSPIAELISEQYAPWLADKDTVRILDMCTGSACIAIATAMHIPNAIVDATDISADALEVASINVEKHNLQTRVFLHKSDMFDALPDATQYDLIVCNPPYVDKQDMDSLPGEYRHEPGLALESGLDGLDFVRQFLVEAKKYLASQGGIILEVGNSAEALEANFPDMEKIWLEFEHGGDGVCFIALDAL